MKALGNGSEKGSSVTARAGTKDGIFIIENRPRQQKKSTPGNGKLPGSAPDISRRKTWKTRKKLY